MNIEKKKRKRPFKRVIETLRQEKLLLPISSARSSLVSEILLNNTLVIIGETGSGKTTQLPQFLYRDGFAKTGMIAVTEPRRVAAVTVAKRVADEMGCSLGGLVGYSIRFEDRTSMKTSIKFLTDGMLLREAMIDPLLSKYSVIVLDEAHERTLHTEVLFGLLKAVQKKRPPGELKLILMSATLDADIFSQFFQAKVLYIDGRQHAVEVMYSSEPQTDYVDAAFVASLQVHLEYPPGDILVFLPGREEIESVEKLLTKRATSLPLGALKLIICPIYAAMPTEDQLKVFEKTPNGFRKVILATNIAETSITINGVKYVIDTGVVKVRGFNSRIGIDSLVVVPISKSAARQRAGRAGRESSGVCFRLYTEEDFHRLNENTIPEIMRCNLASVVLQLKALGISNVMEFDFLEKPPVESLKRALELLYILGAIDKEQIITDPLGKQMAEFPLDPMYSKVLLASKDFGCSEEVLTIVAMFSVESDNVFIVPKGKQKQAEVSRGRFLSHEGDHLSLLNIFSAFSTSGYTRQWCIENFINIRTLSKAKAIREQLKEQLLRRGFPLLSCGNETEKVRRCFVAGFFMNAAKLQPDGQHYISLANNQPASIHPSSVLFGQKRACILFNEMLLTTKQYMRDTMVIELEWLPELAPHYYETAKSKLSTN